MNYYEMTLDEMWGEDKAKIQLEAAYIFAQNNRLEKAWEFLKEAYDFAQKSPRLQCLYLCQKSLVQHYAQQYQLAKENFMCAVALYKKHDLSRLRIPTELIVHANSVLQNPTAP